MLARFLKSCRLWRLCPVALALVLVFGLNIGPAWAGGPTITIVTPSNEIGDVGAALGNVWDMNSVNDVAWKQPDSQGRTVQYTRKQAGDDGVPAGAYGYVLRGVAPKGSDLASAFYTNSKVSIPSNIYHHLIYRSYIAPHQAGEDGIEVTNGRILYSPRWGSNWLEDAFPYRRYSRPHRVCGADIGYDNWCTYHIDLSQNWYVKGAPNPWDWGQPGARVEAFGLWPHENWALDTPARPPSGDSPNYFFLDFVYLTGDIVATKAASYNYTIRWNVTKAEGGLVTSALYYQERPELLLPSQSPACNAANLATAWKPIAGGTRQVTLAVPRYRVFLPLIQKAGSSTGFGSGIIGPANQSFIWNLSSSTFTAGKVYYVCLVAMDGDGQKSYQVSSAPIIKAPPATFMYSQAVESPD